MRRFIYLPLLASLVVVGCVHPRVWRAAVDQARATGLVEVDARLHGDQRFCADVVRHMQAGDMVRCSPGAAVSVDAKLGLGEMDHRREQRRHSRDYVVGHSEVDNPQHHDALHRFRAAAAALALAEEELTAARAKDRDKVPELEERVAARRVERDRAERELRDTPATLEVAETAAYSWVAVHHTWTADYDWSATVDAAGAKTRRNGSGDLSFAGLDQRAFPPADVPGHRANPPDEEQVAAAAYDRAARAVAGLLDDQLARAAALRETQCPPNPREEDDNEWLACRAEVRLLRGQWVRP